MALTTAQYPGRFDAAQTVARVILLKLRKPFHPYRLRQRPI